MVKIIDAPSLIKSAGNKPKIIEEFFGKVNTNSNELSIARMNSSKGWFEPGQCPEFDEYTVVLKGRLMVETKDKTYEITEGQGILITKNEWVRYSSPSEPGAEYIAVCLPAFSPETVVRDKK